MNVKYIYFMFIFSVRNKKYFSSQIEQIKRDFHRFFLILIIKNQKKSVKISFNLFNL
ncbi:MAG: hypothetical protein RLZZ628_319 [Bacteroidota bacterium]|jgi:hypothetical protein